METWQFYEPWENKYLKIDEGVITHLATGYELRPDDSYHNFQTPGGANFYKPDSDPKTPLTIYFDDGAGQYIWDPERRGWWYRDVPLPIRERRAGVSGWIILKRALIGDLFEGRRT